MVRDNRTDLYQQMPPWQSILPKEPLIMFWFGSRPRFLRRRNDISSLQCCHDIFVVRSRSDITKSCKFIL